MQVRLLRYLFVCALLINLIHFSIHVTSAGDPRVIQLALKFNF